MPYGYITLAQFRNELLLRLNSNGADFWTNAELNLYISEALSVWNVLTSWWPADFQIPLDPSLPPLSNSNWIPTNGMTSPRFQTYTETDLYSIVCYHILESQPAAGVWTGTSMFNMDNLSQSAQNRLNEILLASGCNMVVNTALSITPNTSRIQLPDTMLDVRRVRYNAVDGTHVTLVRGDSQSFLRFSPNYRQTNKAPRRFDVIGAPPLTLTVDTLVNQPNTLEILAMGCANTLDPTNPQKLLIPNDYLWVLKYGVLADLLTNEPEATDVGRAEYCEKRFETGLKLMSEMPWLVNGFYDERAVDTPSVAGKDRNSYEWQANPKAWWGIVTGGIDLVAPSPIPTTPINLKMTVVGNAPQPASDTDFIQAPRDVVNILLDYCQHLCTLKQGGGLFEKSMDLYSGFIEYAKMTSARLRASGIFPTDIRPVTSRQDTDMPRLVSG